LSIVEQQGLFRERGFSYILTYGFLPFEILRSRSLSFF